MSDTPANERPGEFADRASGRAVDGAAAGVAAGIAAGATEGAVAGRGTAAALRIGAGLLAVAIVAAALASWRWERARDLVPGLASPRYASLLETRRDAERRTCTFDLIAEGSRSEVAANYDEMLARGGWETAGRSGDRVNYRRGDQVARVAVRIATTTEPGWARIRVTVSPCDVG